jgi:hypothetical protein
MNADKRNSTVLFVKHPAGGFVKTRLAEDIGEENARLLYGYFVTDMLVKLKEVNSCLHIFFTPSEAEEKFRQWLGAGHSYIAQSGDNLGEKMKNAFRYCFSCNFKSVLIIGSDSPDVPVDYINLAFCALASHDVVIGPAEDGGYYLIGFRKETFLPDVFENISWSSKHVFEQTIATIQRHKQGLYLLPLWYDVDTLADLKKLLVQNENTAFRKSETFSYLIENGLGGRLWENLLRPKLK